MLTGSRASALALLGLSACAVPEDERIFAIDWITEVCVKGAECGCRNAPTDAACKQSVVNRFGDDERAAIDAGLTMNAVCFQTQIDAIAKLTCPDSQFPSCSELQCQVYYGTVPLGEPCTTYSAFVPMSDCAQGLNCNGSVCVRSCPERIILGEGDPCIEEGMSLGTCDPDAELLCDVADTQLCVPAPVEGEPCLSRCASPSWCNLGTGICTAPKPNGSDCEQSVECQSGSCTDLRCSVAVEQAFVCSYIPDEAAED